MLYNYSMFIWNSVQNTYVLKDKGDECSIKFTDVSLIEKVDKLHTMISRDDIWELEVQVKKLTLKKKIQNADYMFDFSCRSGDFLISVLYTNESFDFYLKRIKNINSVEIDLAKLEEYFKNNPITQQTDTKNYHDFLKEKDIVIMSNIATKVEKKDSEVNKDPKKSANTDTQNSESIDN